MVPETKKPTIQSDKIHAHELTERLQNNLQY